MSIIEDAGTEYRLNRRCRECSGRGRIVVGSCAQCGHEILPDAANDQVEDTALPCGHDRECYVERLTSCEQCDGSGRALETVSKRAFDDFQRRRVLRGVALLILALIPPVTLIWAVLSEEPSAVCGSWWYGIMIPAVIAAGWDGSLT